MADFTKWGCAIAEALGYTHQEFLDAYEGKSNDQIKEAVYNDLLGSVFYDFMETKEEWIGKASDLFQELKGHAKFLGVSTRVKDFPKAPNILIRRLNLLLDSLKKLGINIEQLPDGHRTVQITNSEYVAPEEMELQKIEKVRKWILENKRDGHTPVIALNAKIAEVGLVTNVVVEKLLADGLLFTVPDMGFYGVSK